MNTTIRVLMIALLALPLAACQDDATDDAPDAAVAAPAPLTAPTTDDDAAWGDYLTEVVRRNLGGTTNSPFLYYLPAESTPVSTASTNGCSRRRKWTSPAASWRATCWPSVRRLRVAWPT